MLIKKKCCNSKVFRVTSRTGRATAAIVEDSQPDDSAEENK